MQPINYTCVGEMKSENSWFINYL